MNNRLLLLVFLMSLPLTAVSAQDMTFCNRGSACWIDGSGGQAHTELKLMAEDLQQSLTLAPGLTEYMFAEFFRSSTSTWLCVQARHVYPDGATSAWYVSETEGVCNQMSAIMPPIEPPPVTPPSPPPPPPATIRNVQNSGARLTFEYLPADCPGGVTKATKTVNGLKIVTLTCVQ